MLSHIKQKIELSWEKNSGEFYTLISGKIKRTLRYAAMEQSDNCVPVFVFHSVEPTCFERQLKFLASNGYDTLDSETLLEILKGVKKKQKKCVALTFDDATGSFWTTAFPLLKKHKARGILFVIPGLVPHDTDYYPNLNDFWQGKCSIQKIEEREQEKPLCTWEELIKMDESGIVDIQSHSLTHSRVNISSEIVDFINPNFDTYFYENVNIPISRNENKKRPLRKIQMGMPVYRSASRLSGLKRFFENSTIQEKMIAHIKDNGSESFFLKPAWKKKLKKKYLNLVHDSGLQIEYESQRETIAELEYEFKKSKQILEQNLPGKSISHFCYPWFQGSPLSDKIALNCGYESVFYGYGDILNDGECSPLPQKIFRISEEYLLCLPGFGNKSILSTFFKKNMKNIQKILFKNK